MDKIDYKKWASMSSLTAEQLITLMMGFNPDDNPNIDLLFEQWNRAISNKNMGFPICTKYITHSVFGLQYSPWEKGFCPASEIIVQIKKKIIAKKKIEKLESIKKDLENEGILFLNKSDKNWLKRRIPKNEIKDAFLMIFGEIPENLKFLFKDEQKELLEAIISNTLSPKKQSDLAFSKQVEILGAALAVVSENTDWTATKIWNGIKKHPKKFPQVEGNHKKRPIDLINKYLNILIKK